jgi:Ser/Thr protein kinase RdoA (MazF antagonist)
MPGGRARGSAVALSDGTGRLRGVAEPVRPTTGAVSTAQPFDEQSARTALEEACHVAGLDAVDAELIRVGENAVFRLRSEDAIARVGRSADKAPAVERQLAVSRWLGANDVPAIRALDVTQPMIVRGRVVAFWESADDGVRYGSAAELGRILRRLHGLARPEQLELPTLTPFTTALARIAVVPISEADRRYLSERADELEEGFISLEFNTPDVVLHGDANVGNLILDRRDRAVLSDLDSFCIGPREWDLALTALFYARFGWHTREEYDAFVRAYGYDILQWNGFDVLADVRELLMVAWLAQNARADEVANELSLRLDTMRNDGPRTGWRPF